MYTEAIEISVPLNNVERFAEFLNVREDDLSGLDLANQGTGTRSFSSVAQAMAVVDSVIESCRRNGVLVVVTIAVVDRAGTLGRSADDPFRHPN